MTEMSEVTEDKILIRMQDASKELQTLLNKLLAIKKEIDVSLNTLDNNYFVEKTDALENFNEILNVQGIEHLSQFIDEFCEPVKEELDTKCSTHEFIDDVVDFGLDSSASISYCKHCHLSKKV